MLYNIDAIKIVSYKVVKNIKTGEYPEPETLLLFVFVYKMKKRFNSLFRYFLRG